MMETKEQKERRLFDFYKNDLIKLASDEKKVRFICIQYLCQYPKIDPYIMAASLIKSGMKIVYDNFPDDMMWSVIGMAMVIFSVCSLRYYLG